jgi:hypothetical protein
MQNYKKVALSALIGLGLLSTSVYADAAKGQKLYSKKLKDACAINGAVFAAKHTQDEWQEIKESGEFANEIKTICPDVEKKALKEKYLEHYYDFVHDFASDSGNVPSC